MTEEFSRRRLLRSSAAVAAGLGAVETVAAGGADRPTDEAFEQIPMLDVGDLEIDPVDGVPETPGGIGPGTQIFMEPNGGELSDVGFDRPGGCSANFVWRATSDPAEADLPEHVDTPEEDALYLGAAGHCFLGNAPADENAAREGENADPIEGVRVSACVDCQLGGGATVFGLNGWGTQAGTDEQVTVVELGDVIYARQANGGAQIGHDFGIVRIPEELEGIVDPAMPQWGGPTGERAEHVPTGEVVHQYGAGVGNGEVFATMGSTGVSTGGDDNAWSAGIRASPGDSGSALVASDGGSGGDAAGVLTHLSTGGPTAGTNVGRCEEMIAEDIGLELEVVQAGDA
jgi:hypothetical protein